MNADELIKWLKTEQHVFMLDQKTKKLIVDALIQYQNNDKEKDINQPDLD